MLGAPIVEPRLDLDQEDRVQVADQAVLGDREVLVPEIACVGHQRRNSRSMASIFPSRLTCRSSPLNSAPRNARSTSAASAGPITRAPRHSTFTLSCSTHWWPVYVSWAAVARMPGNLQAATATPAPDPHTTTARSASPLRTASAPARAVSG